MATTDINSDEDIPTKRPRHRPQQYSPVHQQRLQSSVMVEVTVDMFGDLDLLLDYLDGNVECELLRDLNFASWGEPDLGPDVVADFEFNPLEETLSMEPQPEETVSMNSQPVRREDISSLVAYVRDMAPVVDEMRFRELITGTCANLPSEFILGIYTAFIGELLAPTGEREESEDVIWIE